ncbi:FxsA family protein [Roseovarius sp. C7]|uniref:FxsA family protein n=1 Tax=Roseovarius sp. C7 TaxID=3398643 RepID=UPI0039F64A0E
MWLFIAFLMVPLIEIALFIQVGGLIGLWPTLAIVVLTAVAGTYLVRSQGAQALGDLQSSFHQARNPTEPLAHGAMILFSGALLLTPGFFTDAMGFALLIPAVRQAVMRYAKSRITVQTHGFEREAPRGPASSSVVEGDYEEVDSEARPIQGPSGWTKH